MIADKATDGDKIAAATLAAALIQKSPSWNYSNNTAVASAGQLYQQALHLVVAMGR